LSGVGGESLMTPLLVMGFGIPPATAVGTDLLYAGLTKASCTIFRGKLGSINWKVAVILALGSVPAAIFTSIYFLSPTTLSNETAQLITRMLGVMLCITALLLIFRKQLQSVSKRVFPVQRPHAMRRYLFSTML
ncbi:MAG: sulfite exporter TauE/SafE family protein, partial [Proteobacteria bacterium]|nr:sulfite exporter TauE/SafE family protein [Pseudomonadota bacterium]